MALTCEERGDHRCLALVNMHCILLDLKKSQSIPKKILVEGVFVAGPPELYASVSQNEHRALKHQKAAPSRKP
jgi:hypothetical protein